MNENQGVLNFAGDNRARAFVGQKVKLNANAPYFNGKYAGIAYIGTEGVSVYLLDSDFDECLPINWNEYDIV